MANDSEGPVSYGELVAENARLRVENDRLRAEDERHRIENEALVALVARLEARVAELERRLGQNSGNSGLPSSRDTAAERRRQAEERQRRREQKVTPKARKKGKQRGAAGFGPKQTPDPDEVVDHRPQQCSGCGEDLSGVDGQVQARRQVIDLPEPKPVVVEHRTIACGCSCGATTVGAFPTGVRAPVSFSPRVRAVVVYLQARQHIPVERVQESMADLYGLSISKGAINSFYTDASRRLVGFITALVALLRTVAVLHADETTDRVGTDTCWMHVLSTKAYTYIAASMTRGADAISDMGVLADYRGVVIHDRLALYWKLKKARHGLCGAHLLRDLEEVGAVASQRGWASGLALLLLEINKACDHARLARHLRLAPTLVRDFSARYDTLVADALAANPDPISGRKRNYYERKSYNLVTAFATHKKPILRFMNDLDTPLTNNQAEV